MTVSYDFLAGLDCPCVGCAARWRRARRRAGASDWLSMASSRLTPSTGTRRRRSSTTTPLSAGEGRIAEGGPLNVDTGKHTGRSPKDKFIVREPGSEDRIWWGDVNAEISEAHFEGLREKVVEHLGRSDLYVVDAFAGADPEASDRRPRRHEPPVPRALRPDDVHRPERGGAARVRAAGARPARARSRVRSRRGRNPHGHLRRAPPVARGGADRRHVLCGRDQEVDLHADERPPAARERLPDALLGERRRRGGRRDLLRPLRHRQDDALGRSGAQADRRRRARLGRRRRLQLRGRLLREGDPPLGRGRAARSTR